MCKERMMKEMTEEQIYSMRYYQWMVHGDRYGLRCDLFFYLGKFGHQGFPRYIIKQMSMTSLPFAVSQSIKNWWNRRSYTLHRMSADTS